MRKKGKTFKIALDKGEWLVTDTKNKYVNMLVPEAELTAFYLVFPPGDDKYQIGNECVAMTAKRADFILNKY